MMYLQVALLLLMVLTTYAGFKGLARFTGVAEETDKEGAVGQLKAIESTIRGKTTLLDKENKDELNFPLPVVIDKNHVLVFFTADQFKVEDTCQNEKGFLNRINPLQAAKDQGIGLGAFFAPTAARRAASALIGKRCSDKEFISRDPRCGKRSCACIYKYNSDGILVNHRTCFANYELVDCRPLPIDTLSLDRDLAVTYGRCQEIETSVIELQVSLKNEGDLKIADMTSKRQNTGFQVRDVLG
jgi:hypothetical protein